MSSKSSTRTTRSFFQVFTPGANFWALGTGLMVPIFTAGRIAGHIQAAEGATEHDYLISGSSAS
jgi:outer membrane protein TolC